MGWRAFLLIGQEGNPPPWPTLVDPDPESNEFESLRPSLSPGVYAELRVKSRHPLSAAAASDLIHLSAGWRLFAIGRITYADRNEISRTTEFCRCWRMPEGTKVARFHRVDDPDYENED